MVRTLTRTASEIAASVQPGSPSEASACNSTRACASLRASASPREIMRPSASRSCAVDVTRYRFATAASRRHATRRKIGPKPANASVAEH